MSRNIRIGIILLLYSLVTSVTLVEITLRIVDPYGAWAYANDANDLSKHAVDDDYAGYRLIPGKHELREWTVTVDSDGWRTVPDSPQGADCTIAIAGDSVTFGWAVNDEDTWSNLMAKQYPDVKFINRAMGGYNSANIRGAVETTDANGYIVLLTGDDNQHPIVWNPGWQYGRTLTGVGVYFGLGKQASRGTWEHFEEDMQVIANRQVLMFGVRAWVNDESDIIRWLQEHYSDIVVIDIWTHVNSVADDHPSPEGHVQIAEQMYPHVGPWLNQVCN